MTAIPATAAADKPLTYSGRIVAPDGSPAVGTISLSATFHTAATGGTLLGTADPVANVVLSQGTFSVDFLLDDTELTYIFKDPAQAVWIELKDETNVRSFPRQRFNIVPYALKVPIDDVTLNYDADGRLQLKIAADGNSGDLLTSDGNGGLVWSAGGSGGSEPAISSGTASQYWRGDKTWQTLDTTNVAEGTNLYFTDARAQAANAAGLAGKEPTLAAGTSAQYYRGDKSWQTLNTTNVAEGTNLYYTDARARTATVAQTVSDGVTTSAPSQDAVNDALVGKEPAIAAGTTAQYLRGNKTWNTLDTAAVPENGSLYFTDTRARTAAVAQSITDGVTLTAPSQDQVFDALALKEAAITAGTTAQYLRGDKSWQTLNTTNVAEGTNQYFTNARAQSAAVADLITDGTLNVAPSQNAVFDGLALKQNLTAKNAANGYAGLDASGKILPANLPYSGLAYQGTWNAGTNTPTLTSGACGTQGNYYVVSAGGSTTLDTISTWSLGDWVICGGANAWQRVGNSAGGITTVNGLTGATIDLVTDDINEGAGNLYFSDARAKAAAVANSLNNGTTDVAPSQDAVFDALTVKEDAFAAGTAAQYFRGDKTWQTLNTNNVVEGTNLYFTDGRAQTAVVAQSITNGVTATAPSQDQVFDALATKEGTLAAGTSAQFYRGDKSWQTLDTAAVPENGNLYYTDARARAATVSQVVTDGVITHSPSEDAVFDALAAKSNATHAHSSLDAADGTPANALMVDNAGYVGIGTTTPASPLHVVADTTAAGTNKSGLRVTNSTTQAASYEYGVFAETTAANYGFGIVGLSSGTNGRGGWGRGDGAASAGLYGEATHATGVNYGVYGKTVSSNGYAGYFSGGKNYFEGNVGIGNLSPNGRLSVNSVAGQYGPIGYFTGEDFSASDTATRLQIQDLTGGVAWFLSTGNDGKFAIHQGAVGDRIAIDDANGFVGIGTNVPTAKLHVSGTAGTDGIKFPDGTLQTTAGGLPVGAVQMFAQSSAPAGYLACDGSAVSRSTYSALFSAIGTTYGAGDGSTTFNLPRAKVPPLAALPTGYRYYRLRLLSLAPGNPRHLIRELRFFWNNQWQRNAMTAAATGTIGGFAATVSSASQYGGYAAWQAFTNHGNDYYETDNYYSGTAPYDETSAQWIKVDFGAGNAPVITGYQLYSEWGTGQRAGDKMQLEGSADNSAWTVIPGSLIEAEDAWTITHFFDSQNGIYGIKY